MVNYCTICGKELDDFDKSTCLGCGEEVCLDDYDSISGYCINCEDNYPYCGC